MKTLREILHFNYVSVGDDGHCLFDLGDMIAEREMHTFVMAEAVHLLEYYGYSCVTPIAWIEDKDHGYFTRPVNSFYAFVTGDTEGEVARHYSPQQGRVFHLRLGRGGRPASRNSRS